MRYQEEQNDKKNKEKVGTQAARCGFRILWLIVGLVIGLTSSLTCSCRAQNAPVTPSSIHPVVHPASQPVIHAASAIIMDGGTGATLWAKNPDKRLPPASTTKIATALLLCRSLPPLASTPLPSAPLPPAQLVVTSPKASRTPGHSLNMKPAEKFRAQDLLYAVMLASANDASVAVAEHLSGSESAFAARMNAWAQENGAASTHFVNASGLPAPNHYSTARDLATLARAALQDPIFAEAVRTRTYQLPRTRQKQPVTLTNENSLLWTVPGMNGVKAGWTQEAGGCFVGSATRNGQQIITVVLNSPDWKRETTALVEYGFTLPEVASKTVASQTNAVPGKDFQTHFQTQKPEANNSQRENLRDKQWEASSQAIENAPQQKNESNGDEPAKPVKDFHQNNGSGIISEGHSAEGSTAKKFISLPDAKKFIPLPPAWIAAERLKQRKSLNGKFKPGTSGSADRTVRTQPSVLASAMPQPAMVTWALGLLFIIGMMILLTVLLIFWLMRRKGITAMPDFMFGLFAKRHKPRPTPALVAAAYTPAPALPESVVPVPTFVFNAPMLERSTGRLWLEGVLEAPARLLEPATRRQAFAIRETDPHACEAKVLALLNASTYRTRLLGAELISAYTPRLAEEALLGLLKEEQVSGDVRAETIQILAELGGDRHERLWLQTLLRDGTPAAAAALARLARLEDSTAQALRHVLANGSEARETEGESKGELKRNMRSALIACVLMTQGHFTRLEAAPYLNALPANHGEPIMVATLRGSRQPEAVEALVEIVLNGHAYPALQSLMECDPRLVRAALDPLWDKLDKAEQTRAIILKWLLLGEGNTDTLQELASVGNDLARGALQLGRLHRWEPAHATPDALLAAAQIYSLRLGFSLHAQEDIVLAFRKAATDGEAQSLAALPPELQPLALAYAHPEVYEAVQVAMHSEDGLIALLATLSRHSDNAQYRHEIAFWSDKMPHESRLMLTHALCASEQTAHEENTRAALAERAVDSDKLVRGVALRWLHAHPQEKETTKECDEDNAHNDYYRAATLAVRKDGDR